MGNPQLELFARFEVASTANASFGLWDCAGNSSERTVLGITTADNLAYIDRTLSSGPSPLLPEQADVRAGLLSPLPSGTAATRVFELHAREGKFRTRLWSQALRALKELASEPGSGSHHCSAQRKRPKYLV